jgi:hypothetical protein
MPCLPVSRRWRALVLGLGLALVTACSIDTAPASPTCVAGEQCEGASDGDDRLDGGPSGDGAGDGGGDGDGDTPGHGDPTLDGAGIPCAVRAVLSKHCTLCHSSPPSFNAPMALTEQADFVANAASDATRTVYDVIKERVHHSDAALRMPPASQAPLSAQELAALDVWLDEGAAFAEENCGAAQGDDDAGTGEPIDTSGLECFELTAHAPESKSAPYAVGTARDAYVNFSFSAPWQGTAYGIVIRPIIDNAQVLHHWLLFQNASGVSDGQVGSSSGAHPDGELVHGWAPGGTYVNFREHGDVGFEFPSGTGFTVEMHYNSDDASAEDASGVEVCVQREKPEHIAGVSWLGSDAIFFATSVQSTCDPKAEQPIHILGVSPHMHLLGKHMTGIINRSDGSTTVLHDADFSFNDQTWYPKDLVLMPGETITTTCTWSSAAIFGKGTDEMCYLFTTAYPKGALADGLSWGSTAHGANACLGM